MKRNSKLKDNLAKHTSPDVARLNNESFSGAVVVSKSSKPPSAPTVSAPVWARYVDSRLKQFCSR
jgi:hypothetical protein